VKAAAAAAAASGRVEEVSAHVEPHIAIAYAASSTAAAAAKAATAEAAAAEAGCAGDVEGWLQLKGCRGERAAAEGLGCGGVMGVDLTLPSPLCGPFGPGKSADGQVVGGQQGRVVGHRRPAVLLLEGGREIGEVPAAPVGPKVADAI
jgi:hypothetical protein